MFVVKNEEMVPVAKTRACMHPDTRFRLGDVRQRNCTKPPQTCLGWFLGIILSHVTHSEIWCRGAYKASFCHRNHFVVFRNEHAQSTTLGPKLMFGVVSRNIFAARHPFRNLVSGCIQSTSFFCHRNHFFVFHNEHAQSTTLCPKLVHTKHEFLPPEPFLRSSQRTCPIHYFRSKTHVWGGFAQF
jgi:hypothetical protein